MLLGKYINKYYAKYWYLFLIGVLMLGVVDWIQLYVPEFLGQIVSIFENNPTIGADQFKEIGLISLKVLAVAAGMMLGRMAWRLSIHGASKHIEADLRQQMFEKATRLSRDFYHANKIGTVLAWFTNDTETIEEYFSWGTVMLIDAIFLGISVVVKMFILNWVLALLTFIPIALIVVWGALTEKFMGKLWGERQKADDKLYDFSSENFTGIRVIKAFVKERKEIKAFSKVAKQNKEINIKFQRVSVILDVVIEVITAISIAAIMGFGGYCVYLTKQNLPLELFGQSFNIMLDAAELITFIGYFQAIVWPMIALGQIITMKARAKTSLSRITHYLDTPEDIKNPENAVVLKDIKGKVTFKNLTFKFSDGNEDALKNISFEILPGEKVGIVGKIGCGKTTVANVLTRMFNISEGSVFIDDVDIMKADLVSLHNSVSYVPQDNFLFSDTVKNNIAFSNEDAPLEEIKKASEFAGIAKDIDSFKSGYETVSGERGVTLSGGQKQRISIARAFLKNAPIMILDDSVSAVDVSTEETILNNIAAERNGKTTIVVASRVSTVSKFDKILVLNNGEVEAYGSPKELLTTSETYKRMVVTQKLQKEVEGGN